MDEIKDYYRILGVGETATFEEIKTAFHQLAFTHHPDRNSGNPEMEDKFKLISEAYSVLSDPGSRRNHDLSRTFGNRTMNSPFGGGMRRGGGKGCGRKGGRCGKWRRFEDF